MKSQILKIHKGDTVKVISGKEKGKQAKVIKVLPKENRVILENLFIVKKYVRSKTQESQGKRELVNIPSAIDLSKVMIVCKSCSKPTRIGYKMEGDKKYRICKKCGNKI
jgi:large subunit ribosomal protein L24